jgi:hypothetical protein
VLKGKSILDREYLLIPSIHDLHGSEFHHSIIQKNQWNYFVLFSLPKLYVFGIIFSLPQSVQTEGLTSYSEIVDSEKIGKFCFGHFVWDFEFSLTE